MGDRDDLLSLYATYPKARRVGRPPFSSRELAKIAANLDLMPAVMAEAKRWVDECTAWEAKNRAAKKEGA